MGHVPPQPGLSTALAMSTQTQYGGTLLNLGTGSSCQDCMSSSLSIASKYALMTLGVHCKHTTVVVNMTCLFCLSVKLLVSVLGCKLSYRVWNAKSH